MSVESGNASRVLVTGASGFVGARLVELLYLTSCAQPLAGIRQWSRAARVARFPVDIALCDILDRGQVDAAVERVSAVVHCAYSDDPHSIVQGTKHLLEAALSVNVRRFIYLSSAEVYGRASGEVQEQRPTPKTATAYADAKIEAEDLCREFAARGLATTILRPSLIYGPFGRSWTMDVAKRLQSGLWGEFGSLGEGYANLVYVDDLVQAIVRALQRDHPAGEAFNINGPERITWNDYFRRFNAALDLPPLREISSTQTQLRAAVMDRVGSVCHAVVDRFRDRLMEVYLRGGPASRLMKRVKRVLQATPSRDELDRLYSRQAIYVDTKARDVLGYAPQHDIDAGLKLSVAWLRHHGLAETDAARYRETDAGIIGANSDGYSESDSNSLREEIKS